MGRSWKSAERGSAVYDNSVEKIVDWSAYPSQAPTRKSWQGMMNRCYTLTNKDYPGVGGAGIRVQDSWHVYENFLRDMGEKPVGALLARYVASKDFTKENTYWQPKVYTRSNRLYSIWKGMRRRTGCIGATRVGAHSVYRMRDVDCCPEWAESFAAFAAAVGAPPSQEHTLDRIDNNRGYWPGNVRWVLLEEQANNRSDNTYIEIDGIRKTLQQWCDFHGVDRQTVSARWANLFGVARKKNQKVQQVSFGGGVVGEYAGVKAAALATGVKQGTIAKCLSGGNATAGGYIWRYID